MPHNVFFIFALFTLSAATPLLTELGPSSDLEGRITNGMPAKNGQFPYQVGLTLPKSPISSTWCGGSLIGHNWVLTAAHCTDDAKSVTVQLGITERSENGVIFTVAASNIIQHSGYDGKLFTHDISLIKIPSVKYTSSIQPVRLPAISSSYSTYAGSYAIASGWGFAVDGSSIVSHLNYARLQIISNTLCAATFTAYVTSNTLCVSTPGGIATCHGDSGGPLVLESNGILVGVTSFVSTAGCAAGYPAAFVRVTNYLDWIKANTGIAY